MPLIPADQLISHLTALFAAEKVPQARARRLAELFTQASADGVWSHGVHRVPALLALLRGKANYNTQSEPRLIATFGALQRYDGLAGLGPLNAEFCIDRAMELADANGIGCVALRNTRHWGRPGNCGWRAAERGFLAICWTNTPPNMPAWGEGVATPALGNNPIVFAAPGKDGEHLVLDMALSQFSFGKMDTHRAENRPLPVAGGIDASGAATTDAAAILGGGLPWPVGFWKGAGLAMLLDAFAAILSDGADTQSLTLVEDDLGISQVFVAIQPNRLGGRAASERTREIIQRFALASPQSRYPGQAALAQRRQSEIEGVYVRDDVWAKLELEGQA
ncbi:MAG: Ldh family oxidoreductase [Tepidisphaeraceae bacterium]|jgi:3-dehydro-L-gulonate 2-dehydrogenase